MPNLPYCSRCSRRQPVDARNHCVVCNTVLPMDVPGVCPQDGRGQHNAIRTAYGIWECSRCLAAMDPLGDADIIRLGGI